MRNASDACRAPDLRGASAGARLASRLAAPRDRHVCLIGAGNIAAVHAQVLRATRGVRIVAIVDPNFAAAQRLAATAPGATAHATIAAAIADCSAMDAAHILVPPDLHRDAALPLIGSGCAVLVEKPLATSRAQCNELLAAAQGSGALLGVNQNFVFHPAFVQLRRQLFSGRYGPLRFLDCIYNAPLRQLAGRQFGHWMFDQPVNLLLEQAVHPLSQIIALAGPVRDARALAGPAVEIASGRPLFLSTTAILACEKVSAQLRFAIGQAFPFWQLTAVCDDGVIVADILANRCYAQTRSRWSEAVDDLVGGARTAGAIFGSALRNASDYALSTVRLKARSDPFFSSMQGSIGAFHAALDSATNPELDGAFGAATVSACEMLGAAAFAPQRVRAAKTLRPPARCDAPADVAVLGGTGFIGTCTVQRFLAQGMRVAVMARSIRNLPDAFRDERVGLHRGDTRDAEAVRRAIGGARVVVNLAHGGGGADFDQVKAAMVGSAQTVALACLDAGVERLVHVSSIAALYLGAQAQPVTGATPPDPRAVARADYARAKALCERLLLEMHLCKALPVCILRPGLVVGAGASPFHSGLGLFNNEQHCIGWNRGRNALPFVLVQDVAEAIRLAALSHAPLEGRCYNLVGDVRPSAREFLAALSEATGRPLRFHPSAPSWIWAQELAKWAIKRVGGRQTPLPSRHDILSRGLVARFDCADAKRDLGWAPVADPVVFARLAVDAHAS